MSQCAQFIQTYHCFCHIWDNFGEREAKSLGFMSDDMLGFGVVGVIFMGS